MMEPWLKPMLATAVDTVPAAGDWLMEPKIDGWRVVAHRRADDVKVYGGRNGSDYSGRMPWLEAQIMALCPPDTAIDGELIGTNGWGDVQGHMTRTSAGTVPEGALQVMVFDILRAAGTDVRDVRLEDRKQLLSGGLAWDQVEHLTLILTGQPSAAGLKRLIDAGFEGAVCKRLGSRYVNSRSGSWVKLKYEETHEAVVVGFKPGDGKYAGMIGALELEMLDDAGRTGARTRASGMTDDVRAEITANPDRWLDAVVEIRHNGLSATGVPRHPRYVRRRDDRTPEARAPRVATTTTRRPRMDWVRNYAAMGDAKRRRCIAELQAGRGDAVDRVEQNGGDVARNLAAAIAAQRSSEGLHAR